MSGPDEPTGLDNITAQALQYGLAVVDPVGVGDIARRLHVQRVTVDAWRKRGRLPEPRWRVGGRPAWAWPEVYEWARLTGRLPEGTPHPTTGSPVPAPVLGVSLEPQGTDVRRDPADPPQVRAMLDALAPPAGSKLPARVGVRVGQRVVAYGTDPGVVVKVRRSVVMVRFEGGAVLPVPVGQVQAAVEVTPADPE